MVQSNRKSAGGVPGWIERQVRSWHMARELGKRETAASPQCGKTQFYATISRECGCGAEEIADKLGKRTGFQKFDKELLDLMVKRDDVRRRLYETLDEHTLGWIEGIGNALSFGPSVDETEYFIRLSRAVLAICHNTHAIVIGRGANFILPRPCGLAVRLVAPKQYRLEQFAKRMNLTLRNAQQQMETIDRNRGQFIENHFGKFAYDPRRYDLVINVSQFPTDGVVDLIEAAVRAKAGEYLKLPVKTS